MVALAVLAGMTWAVRMKFDRDRYQIKADLHDRLANLYGGRIALHRPLPKLPPLSDVQKQAVGLAWGATKPTASGIEIEGLTRYAGRLIRYHAAMRDKYDHAARYPWLPVPADPPEPEWR